MSEIVGLTELELGGELLYKFRTRGMFPGAHEPKAVRFRALSHPCNPARAGSSQCDLTGILKGLEIINCSGGFLGATPRIGLRLRDSNEIKIRTPLFSPEDFLFLFLVFQNLESTATRVLAAQLPASGCWHRSAGAAVRHAHCSTEDLHGIKRAAPPRQGAELICRREPEQRYAPRPRLGAGSSSQVL